MRRTRLLDGPVPGEQPRDGFLVSIIVRSDQAGEVLEKAKTVLRAVAALPADAFDSGWAQAALPGWFVAACADEQSPADRTAWLDWWRSVDDAARVAAGNERPWTVQDWLGWMEPGERTWFWWDSRLTEADTGTVSVVVDGWPAALGSLLWLLRASGATDVVLND